jgi:hypothetical protein
MDQGNTGTRSQKGVKEMNLNPEVFAIAHDLNTTPVYTLEYKLPRQRNWRYGFSMKSLKSLETVAPYFRQNLAVDNLCQSHKIKTRIV